MDRPLRLLLGGDGQPQAQQHADAHAPGKHVGVGEDGGHTDPLLHCGEIHVIRGEDAEDGQEKGADPAGGEQVDTHQPRQGGKALQDHGGPAARVAPLPFRLIRERQKQKGQAEGGKYLQKFIEGKFPGNGVKRGNAVHEDHQGQCGQRQVQAAAQPGERQENRRDGCEDQQKRYRLDGGCGEQADDQKIQHGKHSQPAFLPHGQKRGGPCGCVYCTLVAPFGHGCHLVMFLLYLDAEGVRCALYLSANQCHDSRFGPGKQHLPEKNLP